MSAPAFCNLRQRFGAIPPDDIRSPALGRLFRDWQQAATATGALPAHDFVDPLRLRFLLGSLALLDIEDRDRELYRYRLFGTRIVELRGFDLTGRLVSENPDPALREFLLRAYGNVVDQQAPELTVNGYPVWDRVVIYEVLCLPLSATGRSVTRILAALVPYPSVFGP